MLNRECPFCYGPLMEDEKQCPHCANDLQEHSHDPMTHNGDRDSTLNPGGFDVEETRSGTGGSHIGALDECDGEPESDPDGYEDDFDSLAPILDETPEGMRVGPLDSAPQKPCKTTPPESKATEAPIPLAVFHRQDVYTKDDVGSIAFRLRNCSDETLATVECEVESSHIHFSVPRETLWVLPPDTREEMEFEFAPLANPGKAVIRLRLKCLIRDKGPRFYRAMMRIEVEGARQPGAQNVWNVHGEGGLVRIQGVPADRPEPTQNQTRRHWKRLHLHLDDKAARAAAEKEVEAGAAAVVDLPGIGPAPQRPGPVDHAILSRQDGQSRQTITLYSRSRIMFGADRGDRQPDVIVWPPPIDPVTELNWGLYRMISRRHGVMQLMLDNVSIQAMPACANGLLVDGRLLKSPHPGPIEIADSTKGSKVEFPHSGIVYAARVHRPRLDGRDDRLRSVVTLCSHAGLAGDGPVGHNGLLGMEGWTTYDAVSFIPMRNSLQEGSPQSCETLVILVREAHIGSSDDNPIQVEGDGIARVHATIVLKDGRYWLQDMSMGGVTRLGRLQDPPVYDIVLQTRGAAELFDSARITLGSAVFSFFLPDDR